MSIGSWDDGWRTRQLEGESEGGEPRSLRVRVRVIVMVRVRVEGWKGGEPRSLGSRVSARAVGSFQNYTHCSRLVGALSWVQACTSRCQCDSVERGATTRKGPWILRCMVSQFSMSSSWAVLPRPGVRVAVAV